MASDGMIYTARVQVNGTTDLEYTDDPATATGGVMLATQAEIQLRLLEAIATNTATIAAILERLARSGGDGG